MTMTTHTYSMHIPFIPKRPYRLVGQLKYLGGPLASDRRGDCMRWKGGDGLLMPVTFEGFGRNLLLLDEYVDQRLHWFHVLVGNKPVVLGNGHEVYKAEIQDLMLVDMIERVFPVIVIQVGVASEHLLHHPLAVFVEGPRKPT